MTFIEALEEELGRCDFAVVTLTPDDRSEVRGQIRMTPRDNVLFELGLFMGRLGRERTYFVCDTENVKIPTDLWGVIPSTYERLDGLNLEQALLTACSSISKRMMELGSRPKLSPEDQIQIELVSNFCDRICGRWWSRQQTEGGQRLAWLEIKAEGSPNSMRVNGETFDSKGRLFGRWSSVASGVQVGERTLVYSWKGTHPTIQRDRGDTFEGFGQYRFHETSGMFDRGDGEFADVRGGTGEANRRSVELRRVEMADLNRVTRVMEIGTDVERAEEVKRVLATFRGR
jgi:hypothetical protein